MSRKEKWLFCFVCPSSQAYSSPKDDPELSEEEKKVILGGSKPREPVTVIPWKLILSKPPVWALIISHFCHNWGTFILLTWMPTYYNQAWSWSFHQRHLLISLWFYIATYCHCCRYWSSTSLNQGSYASCHGLRWLSLLMLEVGLLILSSAEVFQLLPFERQENRLFFLLIITCLFTISSRIIRKQSLNVADHAINWFSGTCLLPDSAEPCQNSSNGGSLHGMQPGMCIQYMFATVRKHEEAISDFSHNCRHNIILLRLTQVVQL